MNASFDNYMWSSDRASYDDELNAFIQRTFGDNMNNDCRSTLTLDEWLKEMDETSPMRKRTTKKGTSIHDFVINHSGQWVDPFDPDTIHDPAVVEMLNERNNNK